MADRDTRMLAQEIMKELQRIASSSSRTTRGGSTNPEVKNLKALDRDAAKLDKTVQKSDIAIKDETKSRRAATRSIDRLVQSQSNLTASTKETLKSVLKFVKEIDKATDFIEEYNAALKENKTRRLQDIKNHQKLDDVFNALVKSGKLLEKEQQRILRSSKKNQAAIAKSLDDQAAALQSGGRGGASSAYSDNKSSSDTFRRKRSIDPFHMSNLNKLSNLRIRGQMKGDMKHITGDSYGADDTKTAVAGAKAIMNYQTSSVSNAALDTLVGKMSKREDTLGGSEVKIKSARDMGKVFEQTLDYQANYTEILEELGEASLGQIDDMSKLRTAVGDLSSSSHNAADIQKLLNTGKEEDLKKSAKMMDQELKDSRKLSTAIGDNVSKMHKMNDVAQGASSALNIFALHLGLFRYKDMFAMAGAVTLIASGVKDLQRQFADLGTNGVGSMLISMNKASIQMGVDTQTLSKTMRDNVNAMSVIGGGGMLETIGDFRMGLRSLGESAEGSVAGVGAMTQMLKNSGMDIRDGDALNDAMSEQIEAFKTLKALTGESAEQFAKNNQTILDSASIQNRLSILDKRRRKDVVRGIAAERKRLAAMGLTTQMQIETINKINDLVNGSVQDRFKQGASVVRAAAMAGQSDQGLRAREIMLKGANASESERSELQTIISSIRRGIDERYGGSGLSSQLMRETAFKGNEALFETMGKANVASDTKPTEAEVKAAEQRIQVNGTLLKIDETMRQVGQVLTNPLVSIAAGTVGMIGLLTIIARNSWKGRLDRILGSNPGKTGGIISKGAKMFGGGAARVAGGIGSAASAVMHAIPGSDALRGAKSSSAMFSKAGSLTGKMAKGMKLLGGAAKIGLRAIPGLGLAIMAFDGITGGLDGVDAAADILGKKAEDLTIGDKVAGFVGGALDSITFGLIPKESSIKMLSDGMDYAKKKLGDSVDYAMNTIAPAIGQKMSDGVTWLIQKSIDAGGWISDMFRAIQDSFVNFAEGMIKGLMAGIAEVINKFDQKIYDTGYGSKMTTMANEFTLGTPSTVKDPNLELSKKLSNTGAPLQQAGDSAKARAPAKAAEATSDEKQQKINKQQDDKLTKTLEAVEMLLGELKEIANEELDLQRAVVEGDRQYRLAYAGNSQRFITPSDAVIRK